MRGQPYLTKITGKPNWYIEWYDKEKRRNRRRSTGHKIGEGDERANRALAAAILEIDKPIARDPQEMLVAHALKDYWDERIRYNENHKDMRYIEARVKAFFDSLFISQLKQVKIDEYIRKCQAEGQSNGTIRRTLEYLRAAVNHELENERILSAPKFKLPPAPPPRERILTEDEIRSLISHCKSTHVRNSIILMFNTGQRPGAVADLTWFQVDFKERVIHFEKNNKQQTNKRVRPVVMNQEVYELLTELNELRRTEHVIEYVIKNKGGEVVSARKAGNIKKAFSRACKAAGIEGAGRYTLRHTFANMLNSDDKTRSDIMGHTTVGTTQRHYLKMNREKHQTALDMLPKLRTNYAPDISPKT